MKAILIAGALSLLCTLIGTRFAIRMLVAKGYGQLIRDDGPTAHYTKRGTPTMGGLVVIIATVIGYGGAKLITGWQPSFSALLLLFLLCGLGLIGFADDYIKVFKQRSLGLRSGTKIIGQIVIGLAFAILGINAGNNDGSLPISHAISFTRDIASWKLPTVLLVVWVLLMIAASSNGVNLADGLDGLAIGAAVMVFGAFVLINIWQSKQDCSLAGSDSQCYNVRDPLDLAVLAAALTGACFGFLWWNASPAKIFMGDTGSLSLGGAMAGFALMTRTELLLVLIGGLFAAITVSVILQVGFFKLSRGKRIFRMAPLQHHFELAGWAEITIVVRFWLISGLCVATGLGVFYSEWVAGI